MNSEVRTIDLTVVSATNVKKVKRFGSAEQRCYVVAYIYAAQRQATQVAGAAGVNPIWNAPLTLTCYETDLYSDGGSSSSGSARPSSSSRVINLDIYGRSSGIFSSGDKLVGTVVVPLRDIASAVRAESLTTMAFDVRRPTSGKVQGKLNLTVKLGPKHAIVGNPAAYQQQSPFYAYHDRTVENTPAMPPLVTRYNASLSKPSALGGNDRNLNSFGKQEVVTGYPAAGYGFAPLDQLSAGRLQALAQVPYVISETPVMTRRQKRKARRAQRAADPARKARRKRRMKMVAMIVGGVILALIIL